MEEDGIDYSKLKKDACLGRGAWKTVYAVEGHPDLALIIPNEYDCGEEAVDLFYDEISHLKKIKAAGVPCAEYIWYGRWGPKEEHAGVMRRYAVGSKISCSSSEKVGADAALRVLNETSLEDLKIIDSKMAEAHMHIDDLQMLVAEDGHVVVADPLRIHKFERHYKPGAIQRMECLVRYALAVREGRAPPPETFTHLEYTAEQWEWNQTKQGSQKTTNTNAAQPEVVA